MQEFGLVLLPLADSGGMGLLGAESNFGVALADDACFELGRLSVWSIVLRLSFDSIFSSGLSSSKKFLVAVKFVGEAP